MLKQIWMRVGMTVTLTEEEADAILKSDRDGDCTALREALWKALIENRGTPDGETYIPACSIEAYNATHGTEYESADIEVCI